MTSSCPEGANLQDPSNCALIDAKERYPLNPFERTDDKPILIPRNLFSTNLKTDLEQCDGTTSCKYVGFDFIQDTGTRINNMKYNIDISQTGGSKGVFTKELNTVPTMMVAPPGYTYSFDSINGVLLGSTCSGSGSFIYNGYCRNQATHEFVVIGFSFSCDESGYVPDGWSSNAIFVDTGPRYCKKALDIPPGSTTTGDILSCKTSCDSYATCKGFNFDPVLKKCTIYSDITGYSYNSSTFSFTRHDFPTSEGKMIPDARDSATYLGNTGSDCGKMDACNSNIAHVFDTPGVQSFSTTDIDNCGFCPIKTINKVASDYYVRDEVGKTTKYTQPNAALAALQYSNVSNPSTTETSLLGLYKVTPYTGTKSRYIFITRSSHMIMIHAEHHDPNTIDRRTGEPADPLSGRFNFLFPVNAVQFSFILEDGSIMYVPPTLTQFGVDNKITSIVGNGTTTTVTTAMPHGLLTTSTIFLYGDDLPSSFLNPIIISGNITVIPNPESTVDAPKPSVSFTFRNPPEYPYSGSSSAAKMFFSKTKDRGIPLWKMIPVDYVTNGFQFSTSGSKYLKKNTSTVYTQDTMPLFFDARGGKPEKYSKDFADTVFIVEKVQVGSTYTRYECPAVNTNSDYGINVDKGRVFQTGDKCYVPPKLNTTTDGGLSCWVTCPNGFSSSAGYSVIGGRNIGCVNPINKSEYCIKNPPPTTFTVDTRYDMIFDMFTSSGVYDYPENMIFQSLTGVKYLLENKKLRKIKNDPMYYWVMKNSGTDKWNTLTVPSTEMLDDMPKGPDVTVPQDTGQDTDTVNNFYSGKTDEVAVSPLYTQNYQGLTQKAWVTQILTCPDGSYSIEGIRPCTACGTGSTSTADHKACVCSDQMYFWNNMTNTCDLKGCTDNKYNLINGKEPCTECVSGSTASPDHRGCVCPPVTNGTNTWQSGTNTCTLVCNSGYTAYGNKCIDNLPNSIAQAALDLEMQRVQFAFTPGGITPPPTATNADIQNALTLEMHRVMYSIRNTDPTVDGITSSVQSSLDLERERVQGQFTKASPTINDIAPTVQSQLNVMVSGASKYSVPCQPGGGFYSSTGFEPCFPCSTCAGTLTNRTVTSTSCTPTTDTVCTYACNSGFTSSGSGANTICTCPLGSYIKADGTCGACSTCTADTTSTKYTAAGCNTINTTNDRTCTRSCQPGYYDNNGTCTGCSQCTAPANATVTSPSCSANQDAVCKYSCNIGYYGTTSCTSCGYGNSTLKAGKTSSYDCFEVADYRCPQYFSATAGYATASYYDCAYSATANIQNIIKKGKITGSYTNYTCPFGGSLFFVSQYGYYCGTSKQYSCSYTPGYTIEIADDSKPLCWTDCGYNQYKDPVTGVCKTCATCTAVNSVSSIYPTSAVGCGGSSAGSCDPTSCRNGYLLFDIGRYPDNSINKKCTCSYGSYIKADGTCVPCSTSCPANTPSTVYTFTGGCDGFHINETSDRICTRTCQSGYYDNNGTCTACSTPTCTAPTNGTVQTTSCTPTTDAYCTYACKAGFTTSGSGASTTCTCPAGSYIKADGTCGTCAPGTYTWYTNGSYCLTCRTVCAASETETVACTTSTNRVCVSTNLNPATTTCDAVPNTTSGQQCTGTSAGTHGTYTVYTNGLWTGTNRDCSYTATTYNLNEVAVVRTGYPTTYQCRSILSSTSGVTYTGKANNWTCPTGYSPPLNVIPSTPYCTYTG